MSANINRHRPFIRDLRQATLSRARLNHQQSNGEIALAWYRGEAAGQDRAVKWLQRHGFKDAAKKLKERFG